MSTRSAPALQAALAAELEQVVALERVIRAAQAEQFRRIDAARCLAAEVEGVTDASSPVDREFATRAFVAELATTLVVHEATAGGLIADARHLTGDFSATLGALAAGSVCVRRVRSLLDVASSLPSESVREFEAAALDAPADETPSKFRRRIRRLRERIHPEPLADRRRRAAVERRVCLEPVDDGMAWLSLYLAAEHGVAIIAHLDALTTHHHAAAIVEGGAASDPRTQAQLKLDLAADLLLGRAPGAGGQGSPLGVVRPHVYVTVPVLTLLGHTEQPRRARRVRADRRGHRPPTGGARAVVPADPHPPRDRRVPVLRPHRVPGARRPDRLPPDPGRQLPVPGLYPPRHRLRPRPQHRLGRPRHHPARQPRPPLPQAPPPQTPHQVADVPTARRRHPLDLPRGARTHHHPRQPVHARPRT